MFKLFQTKEVTTTAVTEGMTLEQVRVAMIQLMKEENNIAQRRTSRVAAQTRGPRHL